MFDQPDKAAPDLTGKTANTSGLGRASHEDGSVRLASGELLSGRYRIERFIAEGGMGQVYRATDLELGVPIALKAIRAELASNPAALRRFKQEVLLARSVSHPNVCRIFDIGRDESRAISYLTMEYLEGETLSARIHQQGPVPARDALPLVRQLAEGLDSAHRAGIIHRDFKSANIMLVPTSEGSRAVITDFGLATTLDFADRPVTLRNQDDPAGMSDAARLEDDTLADGETLVGSESLAEDFALAHGETLAEDQALAHGETLAEDASPAGGQQLARIPDPITRGIVGTPAYMSPEQVLRGRIGPPSDLYALGVVLFEMVTGRLPFHGDTSYKLARARLEQDPPLPSTLVTVDPVWDAAIRKLLARDPVERYPSGRDLLPALQGRSAGAEARVSSLPVERDMFVGRTAELEELRQRFLGTTRLVSLLGPGGTGKSRLAIHFGWQILSELPGGVWFCDLADAHSIEGVFAAVARGLDVVLNSADASRRIADALAKRGPCLVILDNFEQIVQHAPDTVGGWLQDCADVRFLVTTRERIRLDEEDVLAIDPLDPTSEGTELFGLRAAAHRPGFRVDDANRATVERIVTYLDGMPLAIELAASRLRMMGLHQLEQRLENRFQILAGGKRGRQSTLRATLDWSWDLLKPWERSAVLQASVFEGGFSLEAAEEVFDLSSHGEAPPIIDVLQSLLDKSWLRTHVLLDAPRFVTYSTIQEYAAEKLGRGEERAAAEIRHGRHFATMSSRDAADMAPETLHALRRIDLDNLIAACRRAIERRDGTTATETYLEAANVLKDRGPLATAWQLGEGVLSLVEQPPDRARVLGALGNCELVGGLLERSRKHYEECLAFAEATGNRKLACAARGNIGLAHYLEGHLEEARTLTEAALQEVRDGVNPSMEGNLLGVLAIIALDLGRFEEARVLFEQSIAAHQRAGNRREEGTVRGNLSSLHREMGRLDDARREADAAIAIHREVGNRRTEGTMLGNLGNLHFQAGRPEEALACHEQSLEIKREVGDLAGEATSLRGICALLLHLGRTQEARSRFTELESVQRRIGDPLGQAELLSCLAELLWDERAPATEVRQAFAECLDLLRDLNPRTYGETLCRAGRYEVEQNELAAAEEFLARAESVLQELGGETVSDLGREIEKLKQALRDANDASAPGEA